MTTDTQRLAYFDLDPNVHEVAECPDPTDCELDDDAHHVVSVRGEHSVEQWSCEHHVNVVHWHELTPTDHPVPECEHGCQMTVERIG